MLVLLMCDVIGGFIGAASGAENWGTAWGFEWGVLWAGVLLLVTAAVGLLATARVRQLYSRR